MPVDNLEALRSLRLQAWAIETAQWREGLQSARLGIATAIIAVLYSYLVVSGQQTPAPGDIAVRFVYRRRQDNSRRLGRLLRPLGIHYRPAAYGETIPVTDLAIVPVTTLLDYHYSKTWTEYLILTAVTQGIVSFGFFPCQSRLSILRIFQ